MAGAILCRLSVETTALFLIGCPQFDVDCHRRSNDTGVGHFGAKFANLVHRAAVAPMKNATKRAQEMHFEYKNVTSFRGRSPLTPSPGALPLDLAGASAPDPRYRVALRARHGPLQTKILIVHY